MNIKQILKQPINRVPVSAQFIQTKKVEPKPYIKPLAGPQNYNDKDRKEVERWLTYCAIGTQIIETGTKMLAHKGLIHSRDGIFSMITAFKQLNKHFTGNPEYDSKELDFDNFIYTFLTMNEDQQRRTIKFQESLLNKKY